MPSITMGDDKACPMVNQPNAKAVNATRPIILKNLIAINNG